jgi:Do/DeqQ family serine protease
MKKLVASILLGALTVLNGACAEPAAQPKSAQKAEKAPAPVKASTLSEAPPALRGGEIENRPRVAPKSMADVHLSFAPVVEKTAPAVVNVFTSRTVRRTTGDPFFDRFFGGGGPSRQNSLGSGVIVSPDGLVVTNNHVIEGMTEIKLVFADRREFPAKLLLTDPKSDIAVLKVEAGEPLPYLEFANSDAIEVGDVVLAIGNPFGVGQTVTSGIVSALARTEVGVTDYQYFIQTDAAINPGNSGGALVDINGGLVGVNTAIYSRSGGSNGIGFAVPSRLVQQVIRSAMKGGELTRPWIGASTDTVTPDVAKALKLSRPAGAIVTDIWPGGPAAVAGLKEGDVIVSVDGEPVFDEGALRYRVGVRNEGEAAAVVFVRNGKEQNAAVRLKLPPDEPGRDPRVLTGDHPLNGVSVDNLSPRHNEQAGLDPFRTGVVVTDLDRRSFAARSGLRPGHRILSINGRKVSATADLARELARPAASWEFDIDAGGRIVPWRVGS